MSLRRTLFFASVVSLPVLLLLVAWLVLLFVRQGGFEALNVPVGNAQDADTVALLARADPAMRQRGEYLARLGNCETCHTPRGGVPFAGGRAFPTPYGTIYSSNLTPDITHGLGDWSVAEFRHAMRHGVSRNGAQSPVFPYANFALLDDAELDALFVYLHALPPAPNAVREDSVVFPATVPGAMVAWRMLYYRPAPAAMSRAPLRDGRVDAAVNNAAMTDMPLSGSSEDTPATKLQRGRHLVDGIAHCGLCHSARGAMGALDRQGYLAGGSIPGAGWYAPPLDAGQLARFGQPALATYLRSGNSDHGAAYGVMADVVSGSLQYLTAGDADAIAGYLLGVPARAAPAGTSRSVKASADRLARGATLYRERCADCHGKDGEGVAGKYPPLVDAVAVTAPDAVNAVRVVMFGGVPPSTDLNPRPYSMPPFAHQLSADDIALLVNYIRDRWGNAPRAITADDVGSLGGTGVH